MCNEKSYKSVKISPSLSWSTIQPKMVHPATFKKGPIKTNGGSDKWPSKIETSVCTLRSMSG